MTNLRGCIEPDDVQYVVVNVYRQQRDVFPCNMTMVNPTTPSTSLATVLTSNKTANDVYIVLTSNMTANDV